MHAHSTHSAQGSRSTHTQVERPTRRVRPHCAAGLLCAPVDRGRWSAAAASSAQPPLCCVCAAQPFVPPSSPRCARRAIAVAVEWAPRSGVSLWGAASRGRCGCFAPAALSVAPGRRRCVVGGCSRWMRPSLSTAQCLEFHRCDEAGSEGGNKRGVSRAATAVTATLTAATNIPPSLQPRQQRADRSPLCCCSLCVPSVLSLC